MGVKVNSSGGGSVHLVAPATASDVTLELPTDSVQPGLVLVASSTFSAASSVSLDNCFSADYDNYRVLIAQQQSAAANFHLRWRVSSADNTTTSYRTQEAPRVVGTGGTNYDTTGATSHFFGAVDSGSLIVIEGDVYSPALAANTVALLRNSAYNSGSSYTELINARFAAATAFDGITVYPASGTMTGSLYVYGYRKA